MLPYASDQIILHNIHLNPAVREEGDPIRRRIRIERRRHHLLTVIDKNLRAETVQDDPQLQLLLPAADLTSSLMDQRPAGAGKLLRKRLFRGAVGAYS